VRVIDFLVWVIDGHFFTCAWLTVFFFCRVIMDHMIFLMLPGRRRQSICFSCRDKEEWTLVDSIAYTKLESASLLGCVLSLLKNNFLRRTKAAIRASPALHAYVECSIGCGRPLYSYWTSLNMLRFTNKINSNWSVLSELDSLVSKIGPPCFLEEESYEGCNFLIRTVN